MATVSRSLSAKEAPFLGEGKLSPAALDEFTAEANKFFLRTKVATEKERVALVMDSFKSARIVNWVRQNRTRLQEDDITFPALMTEIRTKFLDPNWAKTTSRTVVNIKMREDQSFNDFINPVIAGNNLLEGTAFWKTAAELRTLADNNISNELATAINLMSRTEQETLIAIDNFDDWDAEMRRIDELRLSQSRAINLALKVNKRFIPDENSPPPAKKPRSDWTPATGSKTGSNTVSSQMAVPTMGGFGGVRRRVPGITPEERVLLNAHKGCTMCRRFYVNHRHSNCPNGYPDPKTYHTLTEDMALKAMQKAAVAMTSMASASSSKGTTSTSSSTSSSSFSINATLPLAFEHAYNPSFLGPAHRHLSATGPSSHASFVDFSAPNDFSVDIESITSPQIEEQQVIAAVLPSSNQSAALGNGTDSESGSPPRIDDDVSPISVPHLMWKAHVLGPDGFPIPIDCMIDSGAHMVLIRPEVVADLALPIHRLRSPILMSLAVGDGTDITELHSFVTLSLSSLNNAWTSRTVRAVIAPGLCTNMLLGLPFLEHNHIVIDHSLRTAIHKPSNFDLLNDNESHIERPTPKLTVKEQRDEKKTKVKANWDAFKKERDWAVAEQLKKLERKGLFEPVKPFDELRSIASTIENLAFQERCMKLEIDIKEKYKAIFEPIPHVNDLPLDVTARIELKEAHDKITMRTYPCPRQYREAWKTLIQGRLDSGFIRPSSSPFASPSFIIPKADPKALPRWVCDYRQLNKISVRDSFPLPRVDDILADCAKGKIWATIDMTDSFFQTRMHPEDIHKTAVTTPFGLYEWTVMPMGFKNSPSIHQRRVTNALRPYIGKICHVYIDDIVIWSNSVDEHIKNVETIMAALAEAKLYVNRKKTKLFCTEIKFLGHRISRAGIEADNDKVDKILKWPQPSSSTDVRRFLGVVRYLSAFLPKLAMQATVLNKLTTKECDKHFPQWTEEHQLAFDNIKHIVVSRECLTVIDHNALDTNKIFVTTDASDTTTGAVLSFGPSWETARPVAFESTAMKGGELNYPTHEKELLAIIRACQKWRTDLIACPFFVYTDHKTLLNFDSQRDLSRRQCRWMEELSQYDCKFVYVKGEDNCVADALSRYPWETVPTSSQANVSACHPYISSVPEEKRIFPLLSVDKHSPMTTIAALITIPPQQPKQKIQTGYNVQMDGDFLLKVQNAYTSDNWCQKLLSATRGMPDLTIKDGLWFIKDRLLVPAGSGLREHLFRVAHDTMGHFGFSKTYESLRSSYFWPNMRKDLEEGYIPSCAECQRNKSSTSRPAGPLHPLPVPDDRFDSVALDFVGPLPLDEGHDYLLTITDRLGADIRLIPCSVKLTAEELAVLFFDKWYCENGLPSELISDRDTLFMSRFWKHFGLLTGIKHKASSAFHPQSDGTSERTNKTVVQAIRFHVERNQSGWVRALPAVRFHMMNTVNKSTGYSGFQLRLGKSPRVLPPLLPLPPNASATYMDARRVIERLTTDVADAKDNLMVAKISQAYQANKSRRDDPEYKVGDLVMLSTLNRRRDYKSSDNKRVAKFMPRFDGPFLVTDVHKRASTVTLDLPNSPNVFPTFHCSLVKPFEANDDTRFPARSLEKPGPVEVNGVEEFVVEKIVDRKVIRSKTFYLVHFLGYGKEDDRWLKAEDLDDNEAVDTYLKDRSAL